MKKRLYSAIAAGCLVLFVSSLGIQARYMKPECKNGERCPSGTYNYCDTLASGYECVCYNCSN